MLRSKKELRIFPVRQDDPKLTPPDAGKNYRFDTLGEDYALERIWERIYENTRRTPAFAEKAKKAAAYDMLYFIQGSRSIVVDPKTGATDDKKYATKILRAINIQSLYKISNYKKNWDREGALPFSIKLIRDIYYVLKKLDEPPAVGPLGEGNIQLEFYHSKSGYYLEVEFVPNGLIYCHSYIEGQKETRRCEMDDIPAFVSEWLKQREAYFAGKKNQGTAEKMKP